MSSDHPNSSERGSGLSLFLAFIATAGFLAFLVLISNGLLLYVMLGVFVFGGVGLLHYLFWGHTLTQQMRSQSEEQQLEDEARSGVL